MSKTLGDIGFQEVVEFDADGETRRQFGSSFFRGKNCNLNPYKQDFESNDFLKRFLLKGWLPNASFISRDTKITAFGSCFAANLTEYLSNFGYDVSGDRVPDIYISLMGEGLVNTYSLLQQFEWALESITPPKDLWYGFTGEGYGYQEDIRRMTADVFRNTDVFIITLGLSEVWYDEQTSGVLWRAVPLAIYDPSRHKFRVCSFDETKRNIQRIYDLIHKHVPGARVIFTLSPISLATTFRPVSCLTASASSKSILRAALDEFYRDNLELLNQKLFYFPAYEIVTDLFPNRYQDDNRHPPDDVTRFIMKLFEATYCVSSLTLEEVNSVFQDIRRKNIQSLTG